MRACLLLALGCGSAIVDGPDYHPTRDRIQEAPLLALGTPVHGSTYDSVPNVGAICTGGGTAGEWSARVYRFVPPHHATYRFAVKADFPALLDVEMTRPGPQENRDLACVGTRRFATDVTLRGGETYGVVIDGEYQKQGNYDLMVSEDTSAAARIRPEDAAIVGRLAPQPLELGRTFGTFESVAGGARPACGGLGSGTLYAVTGPAKLHVVAQFPVALELRDGAGAPVDCAHGGFDAELAVPAGAYTLVVDTIDLAPELFDPLIEYPIHVKVPGAGVRGAFVLDVEAAP